MNAKVNPMRSRLAISGQRPNRFRHPGTTAEEVFSGQREKAWEPVGRGAMALRPARAYDGPIRYLPVVYFLAMILLPSSVLGKLPPEAERRVMAKKPVRRVILRIRVVQTIAIKRFSCGRARTEPEAEVTFSVYDLKTDGTSADANFYTGKRDPVTSDLVCPDGSDWVDDGGQITCNGQVVNESQLVCPATLQAPLILPDSGKQFCPREDMFGTPDPTIGGEDDTLYLDTILAYPEPHELDAPYTNPDGTRTYELVLSNCEATDENDAPCEYTVTVDPDTGEIEIEIHADNLRRLRATDLQYIELVLAHDVMNPLWVFSSGIELVWQWRDGNGNETEVAAVQNEYYDPDKATQLLLYAPGDLGPTLDADIEVFNAAGQSVSPPPGYPPTKLTVSMVRASNDPDSPDYDIYYEENNTRFILTELTTVEVNEIKPAEVVALYDPGSKACAKGGPETQAASSLAQSVNEVEACTEIVAEGIFPRPGHLVVDGGAVIEPLSTSQFPQIDPNVTEWWPQDLPTPIGSEVEYRWNPLALDEYKILSIRMDPDNFDQYDGIRLAVQHGTPSNANVYVVTSFKYDQAGNELPGELLEPKRTDTGNDPDEHRHMDLSSSNFWAANNFGTDDLWTRIKLEAPASFGAAVARSDEPYVIRLTLQGKNPDNGSWVAIPTIDPIALWVGVNKHVDYEAGEGEGDDPLRDVLNGRAILLAENTFAKESEAVKRVQRSLNQVMPRKRRYCADTGILTTEQVFVDAIGQQELLEEDGIFATSNDGEDTMKLVAHFADGYRRVEGTGSGADCVDNGKRGVFDSSGDPLPESETENPWITQVSPELKEYVKDIYPYDSEEVDEEVIDGHFLIGPEEVRWDHDFDPGNGGSYTVQPEDVDGLMEIEHNVVERLMTWTLAEGERYAGISADSQSQSLIHDGVRPVDEWFARTGERPEQCDAGNVPPQCSQLPPAEQEDCVDQLCDSRTHGPGVSYCFGCRQTIEEFNTTVAECTVPPELDIAALSPPYTGNLDSGTCETDDAGQHRYTGLYRDEWLRRDTAGYFSPGFWSGIDCSGFIARTIDFGVSQLPGELLTLRDYDTSAAEWQQGADANELRFRIPLPSATDNPQRHNMVKLARPGDPMLYNGHIGFFYSSQDSSQQTVVPEERDEASCMANQRCQYFVLNANASEPSPMNTSTFFRRVVLSRTVPSWSLPLAGPNAIAKVKLWD